MLGLQVLVLCITFEVIVSPNPSEAQCACGLENTQSRVFYGKMASYRKYPWLVYIEKDSDGDTFICGGSLIDSRRILTAAHCVLDDDNNEILPENIRPYLGLQSTNETDRIIKAAEVSHYKVDPKYPKYNGYDIALIVLKKPVKFTKTVSPICIPASEPNLKNKRFTVVGWGDSHLEPDEDDPENMVAMSSTVPMETEMDFVPKKDCINMFYEHGRSFSESVDDSREVCTYNFVSHADTCSGDSGGPLMYKNHLDNRWYLAGVISRGPACPNHSGLPSISTKLKSISKSIEKMDTPKDFCRNFLKKIESSSLEMKTVDLMSRLFPSRQMLTLQAFILCAVYGLILAGKDLPRGLCECGLENTQSRVFYGHEVSHHKYPWLTHIKMDKNGGTSMCGGSLIDSRRVLTAAHCVFNRTDHRIPAENIRVYLGVQLRNETYEVIKPNKVSHYEVGELYPGYLGYDIALLVLEQPVQFTRTISPICISAYDSDSYLENKKLTVAGWGISDLLPSRSDPNKTIPFIPIVPMETEVDFISKGNCAGMYQNRGLNITGRVDSYREICAYNFVTYADACPGDSGGPLMHKNPADGRWYLAGVVSRGPDCPNKSGLPGIYTKLTVMRNSIRTMDTPEDFCLNY
ncbi:transmembrane protease serine 9-like [Brevipalpus obovatus]|uniref:transmembrane protease serine 9-like n=1 Tax=Brevipalpus obovatus TaxID=246614 RepID=UPI003D9EE838